MARHERAHAVLERLLGAAGDEQHAQAGDRLLAQQLGERDERGDAGEVVVGAGHGRAAPHVRDERSSERAERKARERRSPAAAERRRSRAERPRQAEPPLRR